MEVAVTTGDALLASRIRAVVAALDAATEMVRADGRVLEDMAVIGAVMALGQAVDDAVLVADGAKSARVVGDA